MENKGEILLYQNPDGTVKIDVKIEDETVWLSQEQMSLLFGKSRNTITEHIGNVFEEKELEQISTCRKFRQVRIEGNREVEREIEHYNLDVIISVGYRVKSLQGTQFRIWATQRLKEYIVMQDWVNRLDSILQLNGRELLTHEGKISHELALDKSETEFGKYKNEQKKLEKEDSLKQIEEDIKKLKM
jgi:hypothetical protein